MKSKLFLIAISIVTFVFMHSISSAQTIMDNNGDTLRVISGDTIYDGNMQPVGFMNQNGEVFHPNYVLAGKFNEDGIIFDENSEEVGHINLTNGEIINYEGITLGLLGSTNVTTPGGVLICSFHNVDRKLIAAITFFLLR